MRGTLHATPDTALDGVTASVNKEEVKPELSAGSTLLAARLKLRPGENAVVVTLRNAHETKEYPFRFYVRRPPRILGPDDPIDSEAPRTALSFRCRAPWNCR